MRKKGICWLALVSCTVSLAGYGLAEDKTVVSEPFVQDSNTMVLMHFDEGDGTVAKDSSDNKNDGRMVNVDWEKEGRFGSAASFDGLGGFVDLGYTSKTLDLGTGDFTVEAWVKPESLDLESTIFVDGCVTYVPGFWLHVRKFDRKVTAYICMSPGGVDNNIILAGREALAAGQWYHIACVVKRSEGTMNLYLNGRKDGRIDISAKKGTLSNDTWPTNLGAWSSNTGWNSFNGLIDEFRLSNIARYEGGFEVEVPAAGQD